MKKLGKLVNLAKLPNNVISGHSFRIGSATHLSLQGCTIDQIKLKGRWTSNSYKTYLRKPQTVEEIRQQAKLHYKKPQLPDFSNQANSVCSNYNHLSRSVARSRVKQQGKCKTKRMVLKDPQLLLRDCQVGITREHLSMPDFEDKITRSTKQSHIGSLADFLADHQSKSELKDNMINHPQMELAGSWEALQDFDDHDEFSLIQSHEQQDKSNIIQDYVGDKFNRLGERIVEVDLDPEPLVEERETELLEGNGDSQFSTQSTDTESIMPLFVDESFSYKSVNSEPNTKEVCPDLFPSQEIPNNVTRCTAYLIPQDNGMIQKQVPDFDHSLLDIPTTATVPKLGIIAADSEAGHSGEDQLHEHTSQGDHDYSTVNSCSNICQVICVCLDDDKLKATTGPSKFFFDTRLYKLNEQGSLGEMPATSNVSHQV